MSVMFFFQSLIKGKKHFCDFLIVSLDDESFNNGFYPKRIYLFLLLGWYAKISFLESVPVYTP